MTISYRPAYIFAVLLPLAGCVQQTAPKTAGLQSEVRRLNQKIGTLDNQIAALMHQNAVNEHSTAGVYIYPAAQTAARIDSGIGKLEVSLSQPEPEANGSRALLRIRTRDDTPLPSFHAQVEWGVVDAASGKPLTAGALNQPIAMSASLLPKSTVSIELRFSGLTPDQLGFIRLYAIDRITPTSPAAPDATVPQVQ